MMKNAGRAEWFGPMSWRRNYFGVSASAISARPLAIP